MIKPINSNIINAAEKFMDWHTAKYAPVDVTFQRNTDGQTVLDIATTKDAGLLSYSTHRSLWETLGIPHALVGNGANMPYLVMGNNLVPKHFIGLMQQAGVIVSARDKSPFAATRALHKTNIEALTQGENLVIFPRLASDGKSPGGRNKTGKPGLWAPAGAGSAIAASQEADIYANSITVDYELGPPDLGQIDPNKSGYTFRVHHLPQWYKPMGSMHITFGAPIKVDENMDKTELTEMLRVDAYNNTKIFPLNIAAASVDLKDTDASNQYNVKRTIDKLAEHKSKFVGVDEEHYSSIAGMLPENIKPHTQALLAGYIDHYLNPEQYPEIIQNAPAGI